MGFRGTEGVEIGYWRNYWSKLGQGGARQSWRLLLGTNYNHTKVVIITLPTPGYFAGSIYQYLYLGTAYSEDGLVE